MVTHFNFFLRVTLVVRSENVGQPESKLKPAGHEGLSFDFFIISGFKSGRVRFEEMCDCMQHNMLKF